MAKVRIHFVEGRTLPKDTIVFIDGRKVRATRYRINMDASSYSMEVEVDYFYWIEGVLHKESLTTTDFEITATPGMAT